VSVDTDTAQKSPIGILPLTERKHTCVKCASLGFCKQHCISKSSRLKPHKHTTHADTDTHARK
jgi:hypothetical protein